MISPVQIRFTDDNGIQIDTGPFTGHSCGEFKAVIGADDRTRYSVNGALYLGFDAALHACVAAAYAYIAQEREAEAVAAATAGRDW